jgi:tetratricopeptide (TPR) repeat protein
MERRNNMKHGECLSDEMLTDYLEGPLDPVVRVACEAHLIACDPCRQNLAKLMRVLQPHVTAEEEIALQGIADVWNRRNSGVVPVRKSPWRKRMIWYAAAAAALIMVILGPARTTLHWRSSTESSRDLVQALLSKERPFVSQLAGEPHLVIPRAAANPTGIDLDSLSAEMSQRAASQYDLGRVHLIHRKFPEAIAELGDAAKDPNAAAAVHNDLGVAYMEQGLPDNMPRAEQEFRYALQLDPRFAPAVFNLSLFYDRVGKPDNANQERKRYLQLDSTSGWANEVRLKLTP